MSHWVILIKLLWGLNFICLSNAIVSLSFNECEKTKACFKTSALCNIDTCEFGISWKSVEENNTKFIEFEMVGNVYSDNGYILLGFSEDKSLGDDGIVGCFVVKNEIQVISGNYDKMDGISVIFIPHMVDQSQDFLVTKHKDLLGGHFNPLSKRIYCRFQRRVTPKLTIFQLKDLSVGNKYYIIVARGTKASESGFEKPMSGGLVFSSQSVDISTSSFYALSGSSGRDSKLVKCHGILMVVAWVLCSSVGIIVARYYKDIWPISNKAHQETWLQVHRGLQAICVILTSVAFIIIFIHLKGYSRLDNFPYRAHPILGIIVFILAFINPLVAMCRCKPSSRNRPWFNWTHFFVGTLAYCLSLPTIMIGLRLPAAGETLSKLDYPQWTLIIFVVIQFIVELILEIHRYLGYNMDKRNKHRYEIEIEEYQAALIVNNTPQSLPSTPKQSGRKFRYVILVLQTILSVIVAIFLVVTIAIN